MSILKKKASKINIFKILSIILIIVFLRFTPVVIQKLIRIDKIICNSQYGECPKELDNRLQVTNYRDYNIVKKNIEQILKSDLQINSYLIQYQMPSTVHIDINIKKPRYAIKNDNGIFLIDSDGLVINFQNESVLLSVINLNSNYKVGDSLNDRDKFVTKLVEKINYLYSIETANVLDNELQVKLKNGYLVRFNLDGDIDVLVGSLRLIFSRLNAETEGIRMKEIDLRFKNPVLR